MTGPHASADLHDERAELERVWCDRCGYHHSDDAHTETATHAVEVRLYFHESEQYAVASQDTVTIEAPDDGTFATLVDAVKEAAEKVAADRGLGYVSSPRAGSMYGDLWRYSVDLWPEKPSWVGPPRPAYQPRTCMQCGADMNSTRCRHGGPR